MAAKTTKAATPANAFLGLGGEFLMLGIATGVASISDETGTMMMVFVLGFLLMWVMYHTKVTNAIPNILSQGGF